MDGSRHIGRVARSARVLAELDSEAALAVHHRATVATALELTGVATGMLVMATEYAKQRQQFGRPIGSFQAVKHILADAYTAVQTSRRTAWWASLCLDTSSPDADEAVLVAKATIGDAVQAASYAALQTYGGIGYTWECDLHLWMKRAQVLSASWVSTAEAWRGLQSRYIS
jgi:alkylation response protein AidB-like acyl-CoA dehydrogenase